MSTEVIMIPVEEDMAKKPTPNSRVQESLQAHLLLIQSVELTFCTERIFCLPQQRIAHVQYIKNITRLQGFLVIFIYLVWFSLCSILFWEL